MPVPMDDAVARLGLTRAEVYRRVKDGVLVADKVARRLCFREAEVVRYAALLDRERDLLGRLLDRWLPWFAARLAAYGEPAAVMNDVDDSVDNRVAELGDRMLQDALRSGAADLHLDPLHAGVRLICGSVARAEVARFDSVLGSRLVAWMQGLTELQPVGATGVREGLAKKEWGPSVCQIRVREIPTVLGPHYHLHLFSGHDDVAGPEALGYTAEQAGALLALLATARGLFLIADAGAPRDDRHRLALARTLMGRGRLVVSIERRVQYQDENLIQLELQQSTAESGDQEFQAIWRAALDMSPDVIVLDEVTSAAQVAALFACAASGIVVVLRMAGDRLAAAGARLVELGADRALLGRALLGGVERVLLRRLCPECREPTRLGTEQAAALGVESGTPAARPAGCSRCRGGYAGRRAVYGLWGDGAELADRLTAGPGEPSPAASGDRDFAAALRSALADGEVSAGDAVALVR